MKSKILYEDKDVLVVYKPVGLATQSAKIGQEDLVSELKKYLTAKESGPGKVPYLGVVHRLDQPVEGVLVFAKNKQAAAKLTTQLSGGNLSKHYKAVLCGKPKQNSDKLVDYMYKDKDNKAKVVTGVEEKYPEAKQAVLEYQVLQVMDTPTELTLVDIQIETGRFHQIRAQFAQAGLPLLGDAKYGTEESIVLSKNLKVRTVALCACSVAFLHPVTGKKMSYSVTPEGSGFFAFIGKTLSH